jgi:penicillin-binding protein 2
VFGFGRDTGIDLPAEYDGRVPTNANKADLVERGVLMEGEAPQLLLGDVINMSIGQGLLAATPIQLAVGYSAFANGGYLMVPRVVRAIYAPNTPAAARPGYVDLAQAQLVSLMSPTGNPVPMPADTRDEIVAGLRDNVLGLGRNGRSTTAGELFNHQYNELPWTIDVAGKTGTAQGAASYPWNDSSVFASFSLDAARPYTIVAYLEKSGYGSIAAAPVVKCLYLALADPTLLPPVDLAQPLDVDSEAVAARQPGVSTDCMARTDGDNVAPRPPTERLAD